MEPAAASLWPFSHQLSSTLPSQLFFPSPVDRTNPLFYPFNSAYEQGFLAPPTFTPSGPFTNQTSARYKGIKKDSARDMVSYGTNSAVVKASSSATSMPYASSLVHHNPFFNYLSPQPSFRHSKMHSSSCSPFGILPHESIMRRRSGEGVFSAHEGPHQKAQPKKDNASATQPFHPGFSPSLDPHSLFTSQESSHLDLHSSGNPRGGGYAKPHFENTSYKPPPFNAMEPYNFSKNAASDSWQPYEQEYPSDLSLRGNLSPLAHVKEKSSSATKAFHSQPKSHLETEAICTSSNLISASSSPSLEHTYLLGTRESHVYLSLQPTCTIASSSTTPTEPSSVPDSQKTPLTPEIPSSPTDSTTIYYKRKHSRRKKCKKKKKSKKHPCDGYYISRNTSTEGDSSHNSTRIIIRLPLKKIKLKKLIKKDKKKHQRSKCSSNPSTPPRSETAISSSGESAIVPKGVEKISSYSINIGLDVSILSDLPQDLTTKPGTEKHSPDNYLKNYLTFLEETTSSPAPSIKTEPSPEIKPSSAEFNEILNNIKEEKIYDLDDSFKISSPLFDFPVKTPPPLSTIKSEMDKDEAASLDAAIFSNPPTLPKEMIVPNPEAASFSSDEDDNCGLGIANSVSFALQRLSADCDSSPSETAGLPDLMSNITASFAEDIMPRKAKASALDKKVPEEATQNSAEPSSSSSPPLKKPLPSPRKKRQRKTLPEKQAEITSNNEEQKKTPSPQPQPSSPPQSATNGQDREPPQNEVEEEPVEEQPRKRLRKPTRKPAAKISSHKNILKPKKSKQSSADSSFIVEGNFRTGDFIILASDQDKPGAPIWRIEENSLLQKFEPREENSKTLYYNTMSYSDWNPAKLHQYHSLVASVTQHSRKQLAVECIGLRSSNNNGRPVTPPLIVDHREEDLVYIEAFEVFLQTLVSQVIDPDFFSEILKEQDEYFLEPLQQIEEVNHEKCKGLLKGIPIPQELLEQLQGHGLVHVMPAPSLQEACAVCGAGVEEEDDPQPLHRFQVRGDPYDASDLTSLAKLSVSELFPHGRSLYRQEYILCETCSSILVLYSHLYHHKYYFYLRSADKVSKVRQGRPEDIECHVILQECLQDAEWLNKMFAEMAEFWHKCTRYTTK